MLSSLGRNHRSMTSQIPKAASTSIAIFPPRPLHQYQHTLQRPQQQQLQRLRYPSCPLLLPSPLLLKKMKYHRSRHYHHYYNYGSHSGILKNMTTAMETAMIIGATMTMGNITMDNCGSGNGITSMEGRRSSYEDDDHDDDDDDDDDEEERMMMQIMEDYAKSFEIQSSDTPTSSSSSSSPSSSSSSIPPLSLITNTLKRTLTSLSMLSSQSNDESIDKIKKGDTLLTNENEDDEDDKAPGNADDSDE